MTWDTGSVATQVLSSIGSVNLPSHINVSGITDMAARAVRRVNNYGQTSLDPDGFDEKYEPAVYLWTKSQVHSAISQAGGGRGYRLGDFSVNGSKEDVHADLAMGDDKAAVRELRMLGVRTNWGRTF